MALKKRNRALDSIRKKVGKAINRYGLISGGDRVAVAISGGKDSFVLLETLCERRRSIPIDYEICAVHIKVDTVPYEIDSEYFTDLCCSLNVPFHCLNVSVDLENSRLSPCFLCARRRRRELFTFAAEQRCNRIAFGHHMDDVIETLFLNMAFQGAISTMPPKLSMFDGEFDIIRPLVLLNTYEVGRYSRERGFPGQKKECPYGNDSKRAEIRNMLHQMFRLNKKARHNIFHSMSNVHTGYLPNVDSD